jgi:hypothetical protein
MSLSTILVFAGMLSQAHAADVCKGIKIQDDKFGGGATAEVSILTIDSLLNMTPDLALTMTLRSNKVELSLFVREHGVVNGVVPLGLEMLFLFGEGNVVKLTTSQEKPRQASDVPFLSTMSTYMFLLDVSQVGVAAASPLSSVRLPFSTGNADWDVPKGVGKKVQTAAACFQQYLK